MKKNISMEESRSSVFSVKQQWVDYISILQEKICNALEKEEPRALFTTDEWKRTKGRGGGGKTKVIARGKVFEKGGVNTSVVFGEVTDSMRNHLNIKGQEWFAAGLSLILHPVNPFVPTVHANYRYFELYDKEGALLDQWFGGGCDLTPYYVCEEDIRHFHQTLKAACDPFGETLYPRFKQWCDHYFVNKHRNGEARGVGGIFYDYLRPDEERNITELLDLSIANGEAFLDAYLPLVQRRKDWPYEERHKRWQEIRRGRYVEFNLLYDRGTLFGLKTDGRIESILISLPPKVRFDYDDQPLKGSEEWKLEELLKNPREWV